MCKYEQLREDIRQMRKRLDALIERGASKEEIYEMSVELDGKFVELLKLNDE